MQSVETGTALVLVFDLDGTILDCNSFPYWVLFLLKGRMSSLSLAQRTRLSIRTARLLVSRKIFRLSHNELQRSLQSASVDIGPADVDRFVASMLLRVRPGLRSLLNILAAQGAAAVLATAAAADYAEPMGRQLGFRHVLATGRGRNVGECANSGAAKREAVTNFLRAAGWNGRPFILFTDHVDDIPLMRDSALVCWFGSREMLAEARSIAAQTRFVDCRDMTDEELRSQILPLCNHAALRDDPAVLSPSAMTLS
jgi:phosphoserine phosphatase